MSADEPPSLPIGTDVSAKYKGAFCEAKIKKVVRVVKCKVNFKNGLGSYMLTDDQIKGEIKIGAEVEAKHPDRNQFHEACINKMQDYSQYTVVFDDGDETTLKRTSLCLKSGRHFAESPTLDQFPLTNPEHFGTPVIAGGKFNRKRRSTMNSSLEYDSSDDEQSFPHKGKGSIGRTRKEWGRVVCVGDRRNWYPGVVCTAQPNQKVARDECVVRSFKDNKYYQIPKNDARDFTKDGLPKTDNSSLQAAIDKAILYLEKDELPSHWEKSAMGLDSTSAEDDSQESDSDESSDDEQSEEKDRFVAQLYKHMDERGTPINKAPSVCNKDLNLYKLFKIVHKFGGYNKVTNKNKWKPVFLKLAMPQSNVNGPNQIKLAYKRYLLSFEEIYRKLGCTMVSGNRTTRGRHRSDRTIVTRIRDKESTGSPKTRNAKDKASTPDKKIEEKIKVKDMKSEEEDKSKTQEKTDKKEDNKRKKEEKALPGRPSRLEKARTREAARKEKTDSPERNSRTRSNTKAESAEKKSPKDKPKMEKVKVKKDDSPAGKPKFERKFPLREKKVEVKTLSPKSTLRERREKRDTSKELVKEEKPVSKPVKKEEKKPVIEEKPLKKKPPLVKEEISVEKPPSEDPQPRAILPDCPVENLGNESLTDESKEKVKQKPSEKSEGPLSEDEDSKDNFSDGEDGKRRDGETPPNKGKRRNQKPDDKDDKDSDSSDSNESLSDCKVKHEELEVNDRVRVKYGGGRTQKVYEAKILQMTEKKFFVHYAGWNTRYDEWIKKAKVTELISSGKLKDDANLKPASPIPPAIKQSPPSRKLGRPPGQRLTRKNSTGSTTSTRSTRSDKKLVIAGAEPRVRRSRKKSESEGDASAEDDGASDAEEDKFKKEKDAEEKAQEIPKKEHSEYIPAKVAMLLKSVEQSIMDVDSSEAVVLPQKTEDETKPNITAPKPEVRTYQHGLKTSVVKIEKMPSYISTSAPLTTFTTRTSGHVADGKTALSFTGLISRNEPAMRELLPSDFVPLRPGFQLSDLKPKPSGDNFIKPLFSSLLSEPPEDRFGAQMRGASFSCIANPAVTKVTTAHTICKMSATIAATSPTREVKPDPSAFSISKPVLSSISPAAVLPEIKPDPKKISNVKPIDAFDQLLQKSKSLEKPKYAFDLLLEDSLKPKPDTKSSIFPMSFPVPQMKPFSNEKPLVSDEPPKSSKSPETPLDVSKVIPGILERLKKDVVADSPPLPRHELSFDFLKSNRSMDAKSISRSESSNSLKICESDTNDSTPDIRPKIAADISLLALGPKVLTDIKREEDIKKEKDTQEENSPFIKQELSLEAKPLPTATLTKSKDFEGIFSGQKSVSIVANKDESKEPCFLDIFKPTAYAAVGVIKHTDTAVEEKKPLFADSKSEIKDNQPGSEIFLPKDPSPVDSLNADSKEGSMKDQVIALLSEKKRKKYTKRIWTPKAGSSESSEKDEKFKTKKSPDDDGSEEKPKAKKFKTGDKFDELLRSTEEDKVALRKKKRMEKKLLKKEGGSSKDEFVKKRKGKKKFEKFMMDKKVRKKRKLQSFAGDQDSDSDSGPKEKNKRRKKKKFKPPKEKDILDLSSDEEDKFFDKSITSARQPKPSLMKKTDPERLQDPVMSFLLCNENVPASPSVEVPDDTSGNSSDSSGTNAEKSEQLRANFPRRIKQRLDPVLDNTPPTTPSGTESLLSSSPSHENFPLGGYAESTQSTESVGKPDLFRCSRSIASEEYRAATTLAFAVCKSSTLPEKSNELPSSPKEPKVGSEIHRKKRQKHPTGSDTKSPKHRISYPRISRVDNYCEDSSGTATSSPIYRTGSALSNFPQNRYFTLPLDEKDPEKRISMLQDRMAALKKHYMALRAEVNAIDHKRRKARKKIREAANNTSGNNVAEPPTEEKDKEVSVNT